jgi:hypothetical protein
MAGIDRVSDIGIEAKDNPIVMIYANHRGRKAIDALWSGMHWTTDDIFRTMHDDNWLFAHVMVTGIPERFSKGKPVSDAQPDALSFLVALALSARSRKLRVFHYTGEFGEQPKISVYRGARAPWHKELRIDPGRRVVLAPTSGAHQERSNERSHPARPDPVTKNGHQK